MDERCQLAAAAGAAVLDDVLEDELLDDDVPDDDVLDDAAGDESDFAGSLAVLPPLRESVR
ncbi:hypothetical protein JOJ87_000744 [Rhodococcus ruber]|nr:hypothetical protein [Rhodococcus ruber]